MPRPEKQNSHGKHTLTPSEEAQLAQTIEMFEVITQSQPQDYQSLEILKEAYSKLGREKDVVGTSKRIAQAYVQMGQLSSAILEYETILQRFPDDPDVQTALKEIESKANNFAAQPDLRRRTAAGTTAGRQRRARPQKTAAKLRRSKWMTAGRRCTRFLSKAKSSPPAISICAGPRPTSPRRPNGVIEPFIQVLADKGILPSEKTLEDPFATNRACGYLPLDKYDIGHRAGPQLSRRKPAGAGACCPSTA